MTNLKKSLARGQWIYRRWYCTILAQPMRVVREPIMKKTQDLLWSFEIKKKCTEIVGSLDNHKALAQMSQGCRLLPVQYL